MIELRRQIDDVERQLAFVRQQKDEARVAAAFWDGKCRRLLDQLESRLSYLHGQLREQLAGFSLPVGRRRALAKSSAGLSPCGTSSNGPDDQ